jgi:hypothetical protein
MAQVRVTPSWKPGDVTRWTRALGQLLLEGSSAYWGAPPPRTREPAPWSELSEYRHGDSNPGFRRERAAS